jgi:DNA-binding response OmpR family regulator
MPTRVRILILENDDFLREILGNLLHKKGFYIINGFCIEEGVNNAKDDRIDRIILGTSCDGFKGKSTVNYLKKIFNNPEILLLNSGSKTVNYVPHSHQLLMKNLSIQEVIEKISH